jgi:glyoxylase-like metal-dependent hydrolase (beta-lactamase superfamily II)
VLSAASTGKADVLLQPYDTVTFGTYTLKGLPTPGHTEVHQCIHDELCSFRRVAYSEGTVYADLNLHVSVATV